MRHKLPKLSLLARLAIFAVAIAQTAIAGQQVTLRWEFTEGERFVYRTTVTGETELPNGMGVAVTENTSTLSWEVLEVNALGDATVQISTDRVQIRMQGPMGNVEADSASETAATDAIAKMATALAGTGYTIVFDAEGRIKEVSGIEEMQAAIRAAASPTAAAMMDDIIDQTASEDGIKNMFQQGFAGFPEESVRPGDTWTRNFDMKLPMFGTMSSTTNMTLDRIEDRDDSDVAVIDVEGTIAIVADDDPDNPVAGMMSMSDAASVGTMEWDIVRGRLLRSSLATTMEMTMSMGGQEMVMSVVTRMTMELVDQR